MPQVDYLRECVTLSETLSFTRTAELHFITQPALSRHVEAVEQEVGVKLFRRSTRGVTITAAGKVACAEFREVVSHYDKACSDARLIHSGAEGVITISSPYYWTEEFTEPLVERFRDSNPRCEVRMLSCQPDEGYADLLADRSDVFVCAELQTVDPALVGIPFGREQLAVAMTSDDELGGEDVVRIEDLEGRTIVYVQDDQGTFSQLNAYVERMAERHGVIWDSAVASQQVDTLGMSIRDSGGVAVVPYSLRNMNRSYLRFVPLTGDETCVIPMCVYVRRRQDNPAVEAFLDMVRPA